jgi:hypothetical protein
MFLAILNPTLGGYRLLGLIREYDHDVVTFLAAPKGAVDEGAQARNCQTDQASLSAGFVIVLVIIPWACVMVVVLIVILIARTHFHKEGTGQYSLPRSYREVHKVR